MPENYSREKLKEKVKAKAYDYAVKYHGCSQAIVAAFQEPLGLDAVTLRAAGPMVGGMGLGKICGALAGGVMVLGIKYGRSNMEEGIQGLIPGFLAAQELVKRFEKEFGTTSCFEIAGIDWTDANEAIQALSNPEFLKKCAGVTARTAEMVAEILLERG